jgi:5-amino-6-(D-ribitylamino)uracil---L-tyrosine 4-hydroxyphenyl transferase
MKLKSLLSEVRQGKEVTPWELLFLVRDKGHENELIETADEINRELNHGIVSFIHNRNINYTNICRNKCLFCAFRRGKGEPDSYFLSIEEVLERISKAPNISEVCIQGGIAPGIRFDCIVRMLQAIKEAHPSLHIHAFSPMEIMYFSEISGKSIGEVLDELIKAGLDSIPGTAAEILDEEVRKSICPEKISAADWENIIIAAHRKGLRTTATILVGHIETAESVVNHMNRIRDIQKETGGFTEFIPLVFVPFNTVLGNKFGIRTMIPISDLLKFYALSRIFFNGYIKNVQVSWPKLGFQNAVRCLFAGVNDFGGTLYEENITRCAGGQSGQMMGLEDIKLGILEAGKIPRLRDTLYNFLD